MIFSKNIFVTLTLCFFCFITSAQNQKYFQSYSIVGNGLINPGISYKIGQEVDQTAPLLGYFAPKNQSFYPSSSFTLYWDPLSHVGFQNIYNLEYDLRLYKNIYVDYGIGVGFQTNFTTDNYVFDEDFEISKRAINAHIYGLGNSFVGLRFKNSITERSTFLRTNIMFLTPYHDRILPSLFISIGKTF